MGILEDLLGKEQNQANAYEIVRQRAREAGWKIKTDKSGYRDWETDRKSTRLNSSHRSLSRMPSSA